MEEKKNSGNKNVLWGALFLIGAIALLVNKLGFLDLLPVNSTMLDAVRLRVTE